MQDNAVNMTDENEQPPVETETVNVVNGNEQPPVQKESVGAKIKEWFRKRIVALKRKTNIIPLLLFLISSLIYLFNLSAFSQTGLSALLNGNMLGFPVFVNCLFSILIIVLHLNAFPKRGKKVNLLNYILVYVFAAAMIAMDIVYYIFLNKTVIDNNQTLATADAVVISSATITIVHIVFLGISVIALALLPLYTKLIMKINTSKEIEGSQLNEVIESEDDE